MEQSKLISIFRMRVPMYASYIVTLLNNYRDRSRGRSVIFQGKLSYIEGHYGATHVSWIHVYRPISH